jgi:rod shape-determining protein MreC
MFSKKTVVIVGLILLVAVSVTLLSIANKRRNLSYGSARVAISLVAPFQEVVTRSISFIKGIWRNYFLLVSVAKENDKLRLLLSQAIDRNNQCNEIELSNYRLRKLLNFQKAMSSQVLAAGVIGRDPSPWFKTVTINKGKSDGIDKGLPVVMPQGIVGQVTDVSSLYAKVLLIIDQNSGVDALVQRTRSRGIIKGDPSGRCLFKYVLRKHDVRLEDIVVTSGLDGVYPKGLRIGRITKIVRGDAGIFQDVTVTPFVDFEKIEEVLVVLNPPVHEFVSEP